MWVTGGVWGGANTLPVIDNNKSTYKKRFMGRCGGNVLTSILAALVSQRMNPEGEEGGRHPA